MLMASTGAFTAQLSDREKAVLRLLGNNHDPKSIARELDLSVHTINEYLRSARRKMGVTSSREAARLLSAEEAAAPKSVVDREIGVETSFADSEGQGSRSKGAFSGRHLALAMGATFAMTLIIAAALFTWYSGPTVTGPLPNWSTSASAPRSQSLAINTIIADGERLTWNGVQITEEQARMYLAITKEMQPQPVLVLSHSAGTAEPSIQRARHLVDEQLDCSPRLCVEVTKPLEPDGQAGSIPMIDRI